MVNKGPSATDGVGRFALLIRDPFNAGEQRVNGSLAPPVPRNAIAEGADIMKRIAVATVVVILCALAWMYNEKRTNRQEEGLASPRELVKATVPVSPGMKAFLDRKPYWLKTAF